MTLDYFQFISTKSMPQSSVSGVFMWIHIYLLLAAELVILSVSHYLFFCPVLAESFSFLLASCCSSLYVGQGSLLEVCFTILFTFVYFLKRVVNKIVEANIPVRALFRNEQKNNVVIHIAHRLLQIKVIDFINGSHFPFS